MTRAILITGGSGTFGHAFARRLLTMTYPDRIIIYSRSELRQAEMAAELKGDDPHGRLRFFIGDIRDRDRLSRALHGVDAVVHAAALKRIEVGAYNPGEMIKTNILGAMNLIEAVQDTNFMGDPTRVVFLSTDKAYQPVSPYGQSKALAESLFLAANNTVGLHGPKFEVCRYGNIWAANGSVVPQWLKLIERGARAVPVTDPDCTRFFMHPSEAVDLVLDTLRTMKGGEVAIPDLPAYRLGDLAKAMGVEMEITGLPRWEKAHESMDHLRSSDIAPRMSVERLREEVNNVLAV